MDRFGLPSLARVLKGHIEEVLIVLKSSSFTKDFVFFFTLHGGGPPVGYVSHESLLLHWLRLLLTELLHVFI